MIRALWDALTHLLGVEAVRPGDTGPSHSWGVFPEFTPLAAQDGWYLSPWCVLWLYFNVGLARLGMSPIIVLGANLN